MSARDESTTATTTIAPKTHAEDDGRNASLLRSSATVGAVTSLSRVMGLVRDVAFANTVGANANADAFFIAFKIPNFLRRLFADGAFSQAFIPVLAECKQEGGKAAVRELMDRAAGVLGGVLLLLTIVTMVAAPLVAALFAPGYLADEYKFALTSDLIRISFPYLMLISLAGLCGAVLNSYGRFAVPAFTPVLLNLCLIGAAVLVAPMLDEPVYALSAGVVVGGIAQLLFQLPSLYRLALVPRPRWAPHHPRVKQVMTLMIPALFGVSVSQINLLLDTVLASFLPTGSVSWLYYSDRLTELPLGVFAIAVATVILPTLSAQQASSRSEDYKVTLDWAVRSVLLVGVPAAVALIILAKPILVTLFQYGALTNQDVAMASLSLQAYAIGLCSFMLIKVLAPGYYARKDMKTPVRIGIWAMLANMLLNLIFVFLLTRYFQLGHVGLALATASSAALNAVLLWRGLLKSESYQFGPQWRRFLPSMALSCIVMMTLLLWLRPEAESLATELWWSRSARMLVLCLFGFLTYVACLRLSGIRLADFRTPPIAS
ncbi:MAG: murein biosynthesis integral membrane protein MurJ [Pseudomonadota bacterium]